MSRSLATAGASATGSGTLTYAVAPNAGGPRSGSLLLAGQRVTIYQGSPTVFTDHPIERAATPVKAIHFLELRARIDALRTGAGLPAFRWTDPVVPDVTPVKRVHITELRTPLAEAYTPAGRTVPAWTDAAVTVGADRHPNGAPDGAPGRCPRRLEHSRIHARSVVLRASQLTAPW